MNNLNEFEVSLEKANNKKTEDPFEALLPERKRPIGVYGRLHKEHLKINYPSVFEELICSNMLWDYLAEINAQAEKKIKLLSDECPTPKARKQVEEDILAELICHFNPDR